jgi:hypothetical protein
MKVATPTLEKAVPRSAPSRSFIAPVCAAGILSAALALAGAIGVLQAGRPAERAVQLTGALLVGILGALAAGYFLRVKETARPSEAGIICLSGVAFVLVAVYFFWVASYVFYPGDFLIWSEGDFVNDILKFSVGYPIYSAPANNDSYTYVPGAQLLTYFLAWVVGKANSIAAYRVIQVCYTALAAFMATLSCRRLLRMTWPGLRALDSWVWNSFWYATLLLAATNLITNKFTHNLHGDALAQLATVTAFYLLLRYIETGSTRVLIAMALVVPAGYMVKQSVVIWGGCYCVFLAVWGRQWKRTLSFAASVGLLCGATLAMCYALWGAPFFHWTYYVLKEHAVNPLRSFQHAMDAWAYYAAGLLGGIAVLRGRSKSPLVGAWLASLVVLTAETYTSGFAWMLNHMGPGSLLATVWFLAGLTSVWESVTDAKEAPAAENWLRAGVLTAAVMLLFNGMGLIRIPLQPLTPDTIRYAHDIERQFQNLPASRVLVDIGTWVYLKDRVVMRDRGPVIGEVGCSLTGDYSGTLARIGAKRYSKILVRGYNSYDFVYDYFLWSKSSGIRKALQENYRETGKIPAAQGNTFLKDWAQDPYYFGEISILEPKLERTGM